MSLTEGLEQMVPQPRGSDVLKWKLDWREIFIYAFINLFQRDFLSGGQPLGLLLQQV